ncbi:MAG: methyltransferase domain-containing protein [Acidobacteria bacterium]|nr:methyltransferase domain-containing protein [Acidobacteriota bacterium]MBI3426053.1 methyltransferase domain-containing protein [Acidobacteriota bacterium]
MSANWDERYRRSEHGNADPHPLVERAASLLPPGRALDVACGVGRHALWLAERGWQVTAVDASRVAIELLQARAAERGLAIDAYVADLEQSEFVIEPRAYDLIVVTCYLQRDLFPALKAGVKPGGAIVAVIALLDDDPDVKPMNPDFLLAPGELRAQFAGWELLHDAEVKSAGKRAVAELMARRPLE